MGGATYALTIPDVNQVSRTPAFWDTGIDLLLLSPSN